MKATFNTLLFASTAIWLFGACAISNTSTPSAYDDIYYRPSTARQAETSGNGATNAELEQLKAKTQTATGQPAPATYTLAESGDDVVYISADTNSIYVEAEPNKTYVIVDDDDSYERRLRMFDDPRYTVTINLEWNDPWYNSWYYPYYYRPWNYYSYYDPWLRWSAYDYWWHGGLYGYYGHYWYHPYHYYPSYYYPHYNYYAHSGYYPNRYARGAGISSMRSPMAVGSRSASSSRAPSVRATRAPEIGRAHV